jgi:putative copper export protein
MVCVKGHLSLPAPNNRGRKELREMESTFSEVSTTIIIIILFHGLVVKGTRRTSTLYLDLLLSKQAVLILVFLLLYHIYVLTNCE